jgi:hypothetical protein
VSQSIGSNISMASSSIVAVFGQLERVCDLLASTPLPRPWLTIFAHDPHH